MARQATTAFYNAASAVVLAWESTQEHGSDAARCVMAIRLIPKCELLCIDRPSPNAWQVRATARAAVHCVFRKSVTGVFGIVTDDFGNATGHFGDVT